MKDFYIVNNGLKLNVLTHDLENPSSILIHLHGLHSHFQFVYNCQDEFNYRIKYFEKANILSYALEFVGHGKSDGLKGYIDNFNSLISNVSKLVELITCKHKNIPIFILGESMGGAVAIKFSILHRSIKGLVLLAPMCGIAKELTPTNTSINLLIKLSNYIPKWKMLSSEKVKKSCSKEYTLAKQKNKYQCKGKVRMATARECYYACKWVEQNSKDFTYPILIIHSKQDKITSINSSINFIEECSSSDKEIFSLDSMNHALLVPFNENDYYPDVILSKITNWINDRI
jgi:alpha-beta hydrolase superfamily lysophospholipase